MTTSGRTLGYASGDGVTGLPTGGDGDIVTAALDRNGRTWVQLFFNNAQVTPANPLAVTQTGTVTVTGSVTVPGVATAANQSSQITQETALNTVTGLQADAAVTTNAAGSVSAKLRGILAVMTDTTLAQIGAIARGQVAQGGAWTTAMFPLQNGGRVRAITNFIASLADDTISGVFVNPNGIPYIYNAYQNGGEDIATNTQFVAAKIQTQTATNAGTIVVSGNNPQSLNVSSSGDRLYKFRAQNDSATACWLFIINKATAAANGDAPAVTPYYCPALSAVADAWGNEAGLPLATGIQLAWSSTADTLTLTNASGVGPKGGYISALKG